MPASSASRRGTTSRTKTRTPMRLPEHLSLPRSRSYLPIPLVLGDEGDWEAGPALRELSSGLGVCLFGTIRDVMLWLFLPPHRRRDAFDSGAAGLRLAELRRCGAPPDIDPHLTSLARVCGGEIHPDEVGSACLSLASWARASGARQTELALRQAAALARPSDAALSLCVARLAQETTRHRRAETWFRRTIKLARSRKDWHTYVQAYLGLGATFVRLGNRPGASAVLKRALAAAQRWRLGPLVGEAHHALFQVHSELGDLRTAYEHAARARIRYGASKAHLQRLAADVAVVSIEAGSPRRAIPILQSLIPVVEAPASAVLLAHLTCAAADAGVHALYVRARREYEEAEPAVADPWRRAECRAAIAHADARMGEWERARLGPRACTRLAVRIGATKSAKEADRVLSLMASAGGAAVPGAAPAMAEAPDVARIADPLASALCRDLAGPE